MSGPESSMPVFTRFFQPLRHPDITVSWVGPNPFEPGFTVGSDDGNLFFVRKSDLQIFGPFKASHTSDAINGVAFFDKWLIVSTRSSIMFGTLPGKGKLEPVSLAMGAHGVAATPNGLFVASLGYSGIMERKADLGYDDPVTGWVGPENPNVYRIYSTCGQDGRNVLVSACRDDGIGLADRGSDGRRRMRMFSNGKMDIVDLCIVSDSPNSLDVAAVGIDGRIMFVSDFSRNPRAKDTRFINVLGKAYRILCSGNDLFVLTSKGLFTLKNLVARMRNSEVNTNPHTNIRCTLLDAVDANLVEPDLLMVLTGRDIVPIDIAHIRMEVRPDIETTSEEGEDTDWKPFEFSETSQSESDLMANAV
ncbi:hypothetical protein BH10PLA2_BH10PLA2_24320 [soil metagenome]